MDIENNENNTRPSTPAGSKWKWWPLMVTFLEVAAALAIGVVCDDWALAANLVFGTLRQITTALREILDQR